jgi:small subunit ribosomal protein S4
MARNLEAKCKQCRRFGEKIFLKGARCYSAKCAMVKRNYPPGAHGQKSTGKKTSEYGKQLAAKQKAKKIYRLLERQFANYFKKAIAMKGSASVNFLRMLEIRFDNVVYRSGLAESRDKARQLVNHGHFLINGKKVNIPSYEMKENDIITIREKSIKEEFLNESIKNISTKDVPDWLSVGIEDFAIKIATMPTEKDYESGIDARLIVEFYSR